MYMGITYLLLSVVSYAFYAIGLKPFRERIILFFWVNIFVYVAYLILYFINNVILQHDHHPIQHLLHDFTFTNVPLYILMACVWIGSLIVLDHLLDNYDISLVMPVTEISILFGLIGYIMLGAKFTVSSVISVLIVFVGAIVSAFDELSKEDFFAPLKRIPHPLLIGGLLESFLSAVSRWITFICTHETAATLGIHHWVNNMFTHIYQIPFSFHNPFYYNVGVRFFIALLFLVYMLFFKRKRWEIITQLQEHFVYIMGVSIAFAISVVTYHSAFFLIEDKHILTALSKLSILAILVVSHILLKEKITAPKVVGCGIILAGGLISLIF